MSDLSFDENRDIKSYNFNYDQNPSLMYRILIKLGLAKNKHKARKILIYTSIVLLVLSVTLFIWKARTPKIKTIYLKVRPALQHSVNSKGNNAGAGTSVTSSENSNTNVEQAQ